MTKSYSAMEPELCYKCRIGLQAPRWGLTPPEAAPPPLGPCACTTVKCVTLTPPPSRSTEFVGKKEISNISSTLGSFHYQPEDELLCFPLIGRQIYRSEALPWIQAIWITPSVYVCVHIHIFFLLHAPRHIF